MFRPKILYRKRAVIDCMCKKPNDTDENKKVKPITLGRRNAVIGRIFELIFSKNRFLLLGHTYADEDCAASLVAFGLLLKKFKKDAVIYIEEPFNSQLEFLFGICNYNNIQVLIRAFPETENFDAVFILDTPKPDMIAVTGFGRRVLNDPAVPKIEMDHHFDADAEYSGDPDYRLTMQASSTCEIIAQVCAKLKNKPEILKQYGISELYSRNIILAMLTGMIGDAKLGNYLFKRRDKAFYEYFLKKFNTMLREKFYRNSGNISSIGEILDTVEAVSAEDGKVYTEIMNKAQYTGKTGFIVLNKEESDRINKAMEHSQFVGLIKKATDEIAEKANGIGISAYFDPPDVSDKIQFRVRVSQLLKGTDVRPILTTLGIKDGGGHPGAIGFRFPASEISDLNAYTEKVIRQTGTLLQ